MIVVHVPPDRRSILAELFRQKCAIKVVEAEDKEPISAGTVYFAPPDYHLLVESVGTLALSNEESVLYSRPSIDVLFESAADAYGAGLLAVILTGANSDGARGMRAVIDAGGEGIIQKAEGAYAAAMPEAATALSPSARILSLNEIALCLRDLQKA